METREDIVFGAAHDFDVFRAAKALNRVIARIGRRGDDDLMKHVAALEAVRDMPQQRFARDRTQDFSGKTGRTHARLHDGNHAWRFRALAHHATLQLARICRSGRSPSLGSARHSRSESSAATGPLKPSPSARSPSRMRAMTGAISSGSQQWPLAYSAPLPSRSRWNSTALAFQRWTARSITAGLRV